MATPTAPYGSWPSPIDAGLVASHDGRPEYLGAVGEEMWWTEPRPEEGGRRALMRLPADGRGEARSVLPAPWNVRNRVIEYGGLPWAGTAREEGGPLVVFTHFADQRMYAYEPDVPGDEPRPLTPLPEREELSPDGLRWCDPVVLPAGPAGPEVWCVLEEFTGSGPTDVRRLLVAVPLDGSASGDRGRIRELTDDSSRFVTGPRLSPDGRRAAWLAWDHPAMPWDGTLVKVGEVSGKGGFEEIRTVAGGPDESVAQVEWAPDGSLLLASDESGWWNLQRLDLDLQAPSPGAGGRVALCPREEEFAAGLWRIGHKWFEPLPNGLIATLHGRGSMRLGILDPETGELADATGPWTEWATLAVAGSRVVGVAAGPHSSYEVVELDPGTGHSLVVAAHHEDPVDPAYYPHPLERTFTGPDGRDVHAHVYAPHHPEYAAPEGELPPYVVWVHGGPTSRAPLVLDLEIAYFTSRGIGVVEVNYGGSTGYGRAYRNRLREQWGVVDVEDCAAAARQLAAEGDADPARLAVRGGSAGGWTSAASLTSPAIAGLYACGVITYPILDLTGWATGETHDFESQYLESLVGPLEQFPERYSERSPIQHAERLTTPFLMLQGLEDVICPPAQCERFLEKVQGRGVPHAYLT
ncbi:MAG TPA: prolyl oligopeptidase family serine peptidase, partial [Streptomyces sp.]|nr:prolyl oligopeptidase family serine peptidase [Streptomyces sp.]